ncbi:MAG: YebC/PmpR family DNA-binding transcriptional regulator [Pseudomonadota bacterium]
MAGHSQFKNIMHRKGAQDAKRGKLFTKLIREIMAAARSGLPEPAANSRLRGALQAARAANLARDTIERAIRRGAGAAAGAAFEEVRYEGYGPGGVALIVEALTDNRKRTAADIRSTFAKHGGTLGETNSVAFLFARKGAIVYPRAISAEAMFEAALEAGAENVHSEAGAHVVIAGPEEFAAVRDAIEKKLGPAERARLVWRPVNTVPLAEQPAKLVFELLEALEDNDDIQTVAANYEVADEVMARLGAEVLSR